MKVSSANYKEGDGSICKGMDYGIIKKRERVFRHSWGIGGDQRGRILLQGKAVKMIPAATAGAGAGAESV